MEGDRVYKGSWRWLGWIGVWATTATTEEASGGTHARTHPVDAAVEVHVLGHGGGLQQQPHALPPHRRRVAALGQQDGQHGGADEGRELVRHLCGGVNACEPCVSLCEVGKSE